MKNEIYFDTKLADYSVFEQILEEKEEIGFYDLPLQDTNDIKTFAQTVKQKDIIILGIGGSSLGASAIYKFLRPTFKFEKKLHFLDTTDPIVLEKRLSYVDLNNAFFIVVSKSGTTVETIAVLKYLQNIVPFNRENYAVVTDKGSKLEKFANNYELQTFYIPSNVGGRYSVFTAVGLLPLAIVGVDIDKLLTGANDIRSSFFQKGEMYETLIQKATCYAQGSNHHNINCLFSYSELFREFNAWYVQLWGESLGKKQLNSHLHVGLTPVGLIGPTDQHSFLQLIVDGKRDKSVTFIKINNFETNMQVPEGTLEHLEEMDILNNFKFSEIINMQADSIIESLESIDYLPLDVIEIEKVYEKSIARLMYYFELLTALVAKMLNINAYDQPGVEMGKQILKEKMKKGRDE